VKAAYPIVMSKEMPSSLLPRECHFCGQKKEESAVTTIEKMETYVEHTNTTQRGNSRRSMNYGEMTALIGLYPQAFEAIMLAYNYGFAKGYRAAKADARKNLQNRSL